MSLFTRAHQVTPAEAPAVAEDAIVTMSKALTTDHAPVIPDIARPLHPHQDAAVVAVLGAFDRWGGALLGDDMGMGKTAVALSIAALYHKRGPVVVVAPPANLGTYLNEVRAMFPHWSVEVLAGRTRPAGWQPQGDVLFLSDDSGVLTAWLTDGTAPDRHGKPQIVPAAWLSGVSLYVRDEIHRDKGNAAKPTKRARISLAVAASLRASGKPVLALTGTLLVNRPVEAFLPLQIVGGPELVMAMVPNARSLGAFLARYCAGDANRFGTVWNGANHTAELHHRLRSTVYVRREKSDLDPTCLPSFGWSVVPFALSTTALRTYNAAADDLLSLIAAEKGPDAAWRASRAETITRMMRLWQEAGIAKAKATVAYVLDEIISENEQAVVFYQHEAVFEALLAGFTSAGVKVGWINGRTKDRVATEADFQAGKTQVILAQLQAAGQALTLTAARHAVWVQLPWSAGMLAQQRDRIRRVDQISKDRAERGESVVFHTLQAVDAEGAPTMDAAMWKVLADKARVIDAVNAGQDVTLPDESIMFDTLRDFLGA